MSEAPARDILEIQAATCDKRCDYTCILTAASDNIDIIGTHKGRAPARDSLASQAAKCEKPGVITGVPMTASDFFVQRT